MGIIVIGAGAAGLMAAGVAAKNTGEEILLFERNMRPARKVMITGKGRCNLTNFCATDKLISSVPENGRFLYSAFNAFSPEDTMELFESLGVPLKIERGNRVFPQSDKAVHIVDALVKFGVQKNVHMINKRVSGIITENGYVKGVTDMEGEKHFSDRVIISTGGKSYPLTGSTGDGYEMAVNVGHTVVPPKPSLVPLEIVEDCCKKMQGLSLKNVSLKLYDAEKKKKIFEDFGEMLFTHFGISGPLVLSASCHMGNIEPGKYRIIIDLKPALDNEKLDERILRDFSENNNKIFQNLLSKLLPSKLIPVIIERSGISPGRKVNQITKAEREQLVSCVKQFDLTVKKYRPFDEAIITSGGVKTTEINPKTMESKIVNGLYFAGEVIDVSAYTGGFNLQIAFSTGYLAGLNASKAVERRN